MFRYQGGEQVKAGFYLNTESWRVTVLSGQGGRLEGDRVVGYLRVPAPALLVLIPLMGAAFAMFLPFIGIALVLQHVSTAVVNAGREAFRWVTSAVAPAWRPGEVHFTGAPDTETKKPAEQPDTTTEDRLKAIEDEIERLDR